MTLENNNIINNMMKKSIFIIAVAFIALSSCRNQEQNLNADVEIPVSVEIS